jgi:6-phosphogluconolactonase (cycloisomerase 2 family)
LKLVKWNVVLPGLALLLSSCIFGGGPYTVGGTVTGLQGSGLVLQNSSGKYLTVTASGSFTFPTGLENGATYSVTVRTQPTNPTQTCTVTNGTGTIDKASVTNVLVNCTQAARYAYVANQSANTISAYQIDSTTGGLTQIVGSPYTLSCIAPIALTVDPNGVYLYVACNSSNTVEVFQIDQTLGTTTSGSLTVATVLIATGNGPIAMTIDPTNTYLYVANETDNTVSAYTLSSGSATPISGSPYTVGRGPAALAENADGTYLYVTNFTDGTVSALAVDTTTGQLTGVSGQPYTAGLGALAVAIDPMGQFLYTANRTAATLSAYTITSTTGQLTAAPGSPLATGSLPQALVTEASGKYVYAANVPGNDTVATYGINSGTGALTLLSTAPSGTLPVALAVDSTGSHVYAANYTSNTISVYSVDAASGALTQVGQPVAAGAGPRAIVIQ